MNDALISIKPKYVKLILLGEKSVEIRNRPMNLKPGTRLWIYSTLPEGSLKAVAYVQHIECNSARQIWDRYRNRIAISHSSFLSYVNGSYRISAICLQRVSRILPPPTLSDLRSEILGFQPPQFLKRLEKGNPIFRIIQERNIKLTDLSVTRE